MTVEVESDAFLGTTGGKVWDASLVLLKYLTDVLTSHSSTGFRILELGSGCGYLGLAVAEKFPDSFVTLSEREEGLNHLKRNIDRNGLKNADCIQLDWADTETAIPEIDLIIGSELVYNPITSVLLADLINRILPENSRFIYAHSLNRFEMIDIDFIDRLLAHNLHVVPVLGKWPKPDHHLSLFNDLETEIFIIHR
jgi:predicted nicotinamide N-methyase